MKKIIIAIVAFIFLPLAAFADISAQDWGGMAGTHGGVCFGAIYSAQDFADPAGAHYSVFYGGISGNRVPVTLSTTTSPGWPQVQAANGPQQSVQCLMTSTLQTFGRVTLMEDNIAGYCYTHPAWTIIDCSNAGGTIFEVLGLPNVAWSASVVNAAAGSNQIKILTLNGDVRTHDQFAMAASGAGPSNVVAWVWAQVLIVIGSGLGLLTALLPYVIALGVILIIVMFIWRAWLVLHHPQ